LSLELVLTLVAVFVFVSIVVVSAGSLVASWTATGRRRLRGVGRMSQPAVLLPEIVSLSTPTQTEGWQRVSQVFARSDKEMSRLRVRLARAGFRQPSAPVDYAALEVLTPVIAALVPIAILGPRRGWIAALVVALFAYFAPELVVERFAARRRKEIENGLPDALDLLVVCIEAGSGLDQAIVKTSDELTIAYPTLAEELRILTTEIRAGKARMDAFKSLAQRTRVDDVRALVAMLLQTDRFGTSVGQALRTHADTSRTKRRQRAEERAQKVGVKLVFPLVLFFFPAFYVVVLGPAIIHFIRDFMHK
jgi:tight adherence protein C